MLYGRRLTRIRYKLRGDGKEFNKSIMKKLCMRS
jgi:hypothetical protein